MGKHFKSSGNFMNCREKKLKKNFLLKNPGGGVEVLGVKIKKVLEIS